LTGELPAASELPPSHSQAINLPPPILFNENRRVVGSAPYEVRWADLALQFATTPHRRHLASRFEQWIAACSRIVRVEYLWVGGSFCSDKLEPKDVDAVLFYHYVTFMPQPAARDAFLVQHRGLLSNAGSRQNFNVDSATIPLSLEPSRLVNLAARWALILSNGPDDTRRSFYQVPCTTFNITQF
jgi:hypothetical protein